MCSKMNAIFNLSATIYFLGFIISDNYCLGFSNLIEFVEEWGCHDSEIRLTCGHLDSKIAILEATFAPNCTDPECIRGDIRRLMRGSSRARFIDYRTAEAEAGRKFLQTLRQSDSSQNAAELVESDTGGAGIAAAAAAIVEEPAIMNDNEESAPQANRLVGFKEKRASLRASLERLIVKYLRQISPSENFEEIEKRSVRTRRNVSVMSSSSSAASEKRIMIGSRNVSLDDYEMHDRARTNEKYRKILESRPFCPEQRRKIGSLRRLDIDKTILKINDTRQNIRKVLNKRCSGKNHCSFLFAADDPLAVLWDSGLVYIKYACMDEFHANHYCNEHLTIGYDTSPKRRQIHDEAPIGEPHAEALVQPRSQIFHSLKILKADDQVDDDITENVDYVDRPKATKVASIEKLPKPKKKEKGIYSQDFKVLKILPANLDDFNDIEEIGDEIYFRTGDDKSAIDRNFKTENTFPSVLVPTSLTLGTDDSTGSSAAMTVIPIGLATIDPANSLDIIDTTNGNSFLMDTNDKLNATSRFENVTLIIREGEQFFETFPEPRPLDNFVPVNGSSFSTTIKSIPDNSTTVTSASYYSSSSSTSTTATTTSFEPLQLYLPTNSTLLSPPSLPTPQPSKLPTVESSSSDATSSAPQAIVENTNNTRRLYGERISEQGDIEMIESEQDIRVVPTVGQLSMRDDGVGKKEYTSQVFEDEDDDDDDDDLFDEQEYDGVRLQYTSIQRTYYGRPKSQGFTMTPGYPKFYIGECECKWKILAPVQQKIRLTILDISLRHERNCRDYLQIVDMKSKSILFKSCEEPNWPIEIVSESNELEVIVKADSKFAYPKRGVLLHYAALGCLIPPPPRYGRFVERTESLAIFECDDSYIFPDTATNRRELFCSVEQAIWDRSLPDCIDSSNGKQKRSLLQKIIASLRF